MRLSELNPNDVISVEKSKQAPLRLSELNPNDVQSVEQQEKPGLLRSAFNKGLEGLGWALEKEDRYIGAPSREAIGSLQKSLNPITAAKAAYSQFGEDPEKAVSTYQLAKNVGVTPDKPMSEIFPSAYTEDQSFFTPQLKKGGLLDINPTKFFGEVIGAAGDPTSYIGIGGGVKAVKEGAPIARGLIKESAPIIKEAAQAGKEALVSGTGKAATKVASTLTGVPEQQIKTYASNMKEVNALIEKHGTDIASASDEVREGFQKAISDYKGDMNDKILKTLQSAPATETDISPVIKKLEEAKSLLHPTYNAKDIREIDDLITIVKEAAPKNKHNTVELFKLKEYLQNAASPSYKNGQIFMPGSETAKAAKQAGREARMLLNNAAPEIAEANNQLSKLHAIDKKLNKNLIQPGKPFSALTGAGASEGSMNKKMLQRLQDLTGYDFTGKAEQLSTAQAFANPPLLPMDTTGKSALRAGVGYGVGKVASTVSGVPGLEYVGAAATSPYMLKKAMNLGAKTGLIK